jgi:iron(III) transport system substrate-binding protein
MKCSCFFEVVVNKTRHFISFASLFFINHCLANSDVVNVYSFRQAELISPLINEFTLQTGIKVNIVSGKADKLMKRLINDGNNSFADVLLTVDVARLEKAKELHLIQPISSVLLTRNIPSDLRDSEKYWFGLSLRARAIFYNKQNVNPQQLSSYSALLDKQWRGKICSRKGSHMYNVSLVASFIYQQGFEWSEKWVNGFTKNLAMRPNGGDRDQIKKVAGNECDIAIANSYYYGMLSVSDKQIDRDAYQKVGIFFPHTSNLGTHVNISGAALTSSAKNKMNAIKFIEFLTTPSAQKIYANNNHEYPIRLDMKAGSLLESWGKLSPDTKSIRKLSRYHEKAKAIIKKSNW